MKYEKTEPWRLPETIGPDKSRVKTLGNQILAARQRLEDPEYRRRVADNMITETGLAWDDKGRDICVDLGRVVEISHGPKTDQTTHEAILARLEAGHWPQSEGVLSAARSEESAQVAGLELARKPWAAGRWLWLHSLDSWIGQRVATAIAAGYLRQHAEAKVSFFRAADYLESRRPADEGRHRPPEPKLAELTVIQGLWSCNFTEWSAAELLALIERLDGRPESNRVVFIDRAGIRGKMASGSIELQALQAILARRAELIALPNR